MQGNSGCYKRGIDLIRIEKGLRTWELVDLDSFLLNYLAKEKFKDFEYRKDILTYEVAELTKSSVYKRYYGKYEIDLITKLSDILMTTLLLAKISKIDIRDLMNISIQRYYERVYEKKVIA